jgi:hypothetical protein
LIGCSSPIEPPTNNLHEISVKWQASSGTDYAVVRVRLFASQRVVGMAEHVGASASPL